MEEKVYNAVKEPLEKEGIILDSVHLGTEDGEKTLFVTITSEKEVDVNMCVKATKIVNPIIDDLDLDLSEYVLDVGSKGVSDNEQ
jgi:ribosome maturation factor RimP